MVTAIYVQNYTSLAFDCAPTLESEELDEDCQQYWSNLRYFIKPKYSAKIAELSRDYLFRSGQIYYFSFYLSISQSTHNSSITDNLKSPRATSAQRYPASPSNKCLMLKVKTEESDIRAELLFGVHSLPFGTCYPEFVWKHSTAWNSSYWVTLDVGNVLRCIEIKYRSVFSGGDADLEWVLSEVEIPSQNWSEIKGNFTYPYYAVSRGKAVSELVVEEQAWEFQSRIAGTSSDFSAVARADTCLWISTDAEKSIPIWHVYLPSPRWIWIEDGWRCGKWMYSSGSMSSSVWSDAPPTTPFKMRKRMWCRKRACRTFFKSTERDIFSAIAPSLTPTRRRSASRMELGDAVFEGVARIFEADWVLEQIAKVRNDSGRLAFVAKHCKELGECEFLGTVLDSFEYECNRMKALKRFLDVSGSKNIELERFQYLAFRKELLKN